MTKSRKQLSKRQQKRLTSENKRGAVAFAAAYCIEHQCSAMEAVRKKVVSLSQLSTLKSRIKTLRNKPILDHAREAELSTLSPARKAQKLAEALRESMDEREVRNLTISFSHPVRSCSRPKDPILSKS